MDLLCVYAEALHWHNEPIRSSSSCSPDAFGLGRIYGLQGEKKEAGLGFRAVANLALLSAEDQCRMARWFFFGNNLAQAAEYCGRTLFADLSHSGAQDLIDKIKIILSELQGV